MTEEATDGKARGGGKSAGFAALVAAGILLSRLAGLLREKVFAHYFGNSLAAGAFRAALRIPNLLQNLFGEGVLSASFIPVYSRLLAEGDEKLAGRVAGAIAALLSVVMMVLVAIGVLMTPLLINFITPGFKGELRELTIQLVRILFPATGLLVMSAWCLGVLNSHRKFFLSYVAPVVWSGAMIVAMVTMGGRVDQDRLAVILAWATVIGSALQFGIQLPFVFKYGRHFSFRMATHLEPVKKVIRSTGPVFIGKGAVQLSAYIDLWVASLLGAAAMSGLGYAQTIYLLPVSLFGMSVAAAELPEMSGAVGTESEVAMVLRERLARALRHVAFFVVPSVVALVLIGDHLVAALYQGGEFRTADTVFVWYLLIGSTVGLLAATQARAVNSTFYALHDTKTPLRFALVRIAAGAVLGLLFAFPLRPMMLSLMEAAGVPLPAIANAPVLMGAVGLSLGSALAGWLEFLLLRRTLTRRIGAIPHSFKTSFSLWGSALVAAAVARAFAPLIQQIVANAPFPFVLAGVGIAGVFGVLYLAATVLTGVREARALAGRVVPALRPR